jgi:hypothetical protein
MFGVKHPPPMSPTLYQIFALNRSGHRVSAIEKETDPQRAESMVASRNRGCGNPRWVALPVDRVSGRPLGDPIAHADAGVSEA